MRPTTNTTHDMTQCNTTRQAGEPLTFASRPVCARFDGPLEGGHRVLGEHRREAAVPNEQG